MKRRVGDGVPRVLWVVGGVEVLAPADWPESRVLAETRGAVTAVRTPVPFAHPEIAPRSLAYALRPLNMAREVVDGHEWSCTQHAAWRDDAPLPSFRHERHRGPPRESIEAFIGGRRMKRRAFPRMLSRVPDEPVKDSALFVRSDGVGVRVHIDFAPWWPLLMEQEDSADGMIRVVRNDAVVAYLMPHHQRKGG